MQGQRSAGVRAAGPLPRPLLRPGSGGAGNCPLLAGGGTGGRGSGRAGGGSMGRDQVSQFQGSKLGVCYGGVQVGQVEVPGGGGW